MKTIIKLTLVVCLFSSFAIADDGNMGNGSKNCNVTPCFAGEPPVDSNGEKDSVEPSETVIKSIFDAVFEISEIVF